MPFTFSHAAAVLPFAKFTGKRLSLTGLILGSMAPDFEYFLRVRADGIYGHEVHGFFWLDLPLCVFFAFLHHHLVRDPLINHLPAIFSRRLRPFQAFSFAAYFRQHGFIFLLSSFLGILTHVFWDSFTHEEQFFAQQIGLLQQAVLLAGHEVKTVTIAQYGSSLLGALVILAFVFALPPVQETRVPLWQKLKYWSVVGLVTAVVVVVAIATGLPVSLSEIGELIVATVSGGTMGLVVAAFLFREKKKQPVF